MLQKIRREVHARINSTDDDRGSDNLKLDVPLQTPPPSSSVNSICYFPPQMDPSVNTSTRALRESPVWLMLQDAGVLFKMLPYLPYIFLPVKASSSSDELFLDSKGAWEMIIQVSLFFVEIVLLAGNPIALVFLPGLLYIPMTSLVCLIVYLIGWPLQGPNVCYSNLDNTTAASADSHGNERWLFVNGCTTSHAGLQKNIDLLSKTFGRRIIGIHNKSFGLIADLLECLVQRCFAYKTNDVRVAYQSIKPLLMDPTVAKIVLLGHSQGGIIISLVLDHFFAELPAENMAKLEVYTFGSAASHFSNPATSFCSSSKQTSLNPKVHLDDSSSPARQQHVIAHIEHYANEYDMISRWGVLHSICDIQDNRYSGSVFVRMQASGHMFNQHYMDAMFPLPRPKDNPSIINFLDHLVSTDLELAWKRTVAPSVEFATFPRNDTGLEFGTGQRILPTDQGMASAFDADGAVPAIVAQGRKPVMIFSRTTSGAVVCEVESGRPVRELSRLWKYLDGKSPVSTDPAGFSLSSRECLEGVLSGQ